MADANQILRTIFDLRDDNGVVTLDALCVAVAGTPLRVNDPERKQVIKSIGGLVSRGLVKSLGAVPGKFPASAHAGYTVTPKGEAFIAAGKVIKPGPKGKLAAPRTLAKETFTDRLWKALRQSPNKRATVNELVELAGAIGNVKTALTAAHRYLKALSEVGITQKMAHRAKGFALTSNGFVRYAILKDRGPKAPVIYRDYIFDPNANERIARERVETASKTEAA